MASRCKRDWTVEEFDDWMAADKDAASTRDVTGEEGGPRLTMVPTPKCLPTVSAPDTVDPTATAATGDVTVVAFEPEASRKKLGWSAARQRQFIEALAETGSVHLAAKAAGLSARSAYAVRVRSAAFAAAWDAAQQMAVGRLSTLAFDRAIHGRVEQVYSEGTLVAEKRVPSDRLLMWLLSRLDPKRFATPAERPTGDAADPVGKVQLAFPAMLGALTDMTREWPHEREHCEHSAE